MRRRSAVVAACVLGLISTPCWILAGAADTGASSSGQGFYRVTAVAEVEDTPAVFEQVAGQDGLGADDFREVEAYAGGLRGGILKPGETGQVAQQGVPELVIREANADDEDESKTAEAATGIAAALVAAVFAAVSSAAGDALDAVVSVLSSAPSSRDGGGNDNADRFEFLDEEELELPGEWSLSDRRTSREGWSRIGGSLASEASAGLERMGGDSSRARVGSDASGSRVAGDSLWRDHVALDEDTEHRVLQAVTPSPVSISSTPQPVGEGTPQPVGQDTPEPVPTPIPEPAVEDTPQPFSTPVPFATTDEVTTGPVVSPAPQATTVVTPQPFTVTTPQPAAADEVTTQPSPTTVTPGPTTELTLRPSATTTPQPTANEVMTQPSPTTVTPVPTTELTLRPSATTTPQPTANEATTQPSPTTVTPVPTTELTLRPSATTTPQPTANEVATPSPGATTSPQTSSPQPTLAPAVTTAPMETPSPSATAASNATESPGPATPSPVGINATVAPSATLAPSIAPVPSLEPNATLAPTLTPAPSLVPNVTVAPSLAPNVTYVPTPVPSTTFVPTLAPNGTVAPSLAPNITDAPTPVPSTTFVPTLAPNGTVAPSLAPNITDAPSPAPNATAAPSLAPNDTLAPSLAPNGTFTPTMVPSATPVPTSAPSTTPDSTTDSAGTSAPTETDFFTPSPTGNSTDDDALETTGDVASGVAAGAVASTAAVVTVTTVTATGAATTATATATTTTVVSAAAPTATTTTTTATAATTTTTTTGTTTTVTTTGTSTGTTTTGTTGSSTATGTTASTSNVSTRSPSSTLGLIMIFQLQFASLLRLVEANITKPFMDFVDNLNWINLHFNVEYTFFGCDEEVDYKLDGQDDDDTWAFNTFLVFGFLVMLTVIHILVVSYAEAVWLAQANAIHRHRLELLGQRASVHFSGNDAAVYDKYLDIANRDRELEEHEKLSTERYLARHNSVWMYFPHLELLFLLFVYQGASAAEAQLIRSSCTANVVLGVLALIVFPILMFLYVSRIVWRRVQSRNPPVVFVHESEDEGWSITKACRGICSGWIHGRSMFEWADKGSWRSRNDEEVDLDSRKFRIGFEPLFVDYTQRGAIYVSFLLVEWMAFGLITAFVANGTVQSGAIFAIYCVDVLILVCLRPFANSFIQWVQTLTVLCDAVTLAGMVYASVLDPDDDDDADRLEIVYAVLLGVQTLAILFLIIPIYLDAFIVLVGTLLTWISNQIFSGIKETRITPPTKTNNSEVCMIFCALVRENFIGCVRSTVRGPTHNPRAAAEARLRDASKRMLEPVDEDSMGSPGLGIFAKGVRASQQPERTSGRIPEGSLTELEESRRGFEPVPQAGSDGTPTRAPGFEEEKRQVLNGDGESAPLRELGDRRVSRSGIHAYV